MATTFLKDSGQMPRARHKARISKWKILLPFLATKLTYMVKYLCAVHLKLHYVAFCGAVLGAEHVLFQSLESKVRKG